MHGARVHEVIAASRPAQYTTVLKMLQIMTTKGLVVREEKNRAHRYEAAKPREWTQRQLAGDFMHRAFGGSAAGLLLGALSAKKASRQEIAEMRRMLDEYESSKGTGRKS